MIVTMPTRPIPVRHAWALVYFNRWGARETVRSTHRYRWQARLANGLADQVVPVAVLTDRKTAPDVPVHPFPHLAALVN